MTTVVRSFLMLLTTFILFCPGLNIIRYTILHCRVIMNCNLPGLSTDWPTCQFVIPCNGHRTPHETKGNGYGNDIQWPRKPALALTSWFARYVLALNCLVLVFVMSLSVIKKSALAWKWDLCSVYIRLFDELSHGLFAVWPPPHFILLNILVFRPFQL